MCIYGKIQWNLDEKTIFAAQKGNKQTDAEAHAQSNDNYYRIAGNTGEQKGKKA